MNILSLILISIMAGTGIGYLVTDWVCRGKPGDSGCGYGFYFFSPISAVVLFIIFSVLYWLLSRHNLLNISKKYQAIILVISILAFLFFAVIVLRETMGLILF